MKSDFGSSKHRVSSGDGFGAGSRQRATLGTERPLNDYQGYDLVGDTHGHADALHRLALDYFGIEGVFRHPERQMIFIGDFIDRGPQQREVLQIARSMCDTGAAGAVMGNHEFNAIGRAAQDKDGALLKSHSAKNANQHAKFLSQIGENSATYHVRAIMRASII